MEPNDRKRPRSPGSPLLVPETRRPPWAKADIPHLPEADHTTQAIAQSIAQGALPAHGPSDGNEASSGPNAQADAPEVLNIAPEVEDFTDYPDTVKTKHAGIEIVVQPNFEDAIYRALRVQYQKIIERTVEKLDPEVHCGKIMHLQDVCSLLFTDGYEQPARLISRHKQDWSKLLGAVNATLTDEFYDLCQRPLCLWRKCEKDLWDHNFVTPAQERLDDYHSDLDLLSDIMLDVEDLLKRRDVVRTLLESVKAE